MCFCKQFLENTSFIIQSPSEAVFGDLSPCPNITRTMQNRRSYSWNFYFITWAHHLKDLLLFHFAPIHIWCMWTNTATSLTLVDSRGLNEWMPAGPGGWNAIAGRVSSFSFGRCVLAFLVKKKRILVTGFSSCFYMKAWEHNWIMQHMYEKVTFQFCQQLVANDSWLGFQVYFKNNYELLVCWVLLKGAY